MNSFGNLDSTSISDLCAFLFSHLNDGTSCHLSLKHSRKINLRAKLVHLQSHLLSSKCPPAYSTLWPHLLVFARDFIQFHPSETTLLSELILPMIQYFNGNHPLTNAPKREWNQEYHEITLGILAPLCTFESSLQSCPQFTLFIQNYLEYAFQTIQIHHQHFTRDHYSLQSSSYPLLLSYLQSVHYFIYAYAGDAFSVLASYGNIQFLYSVEAGASDDI